MPENFQYSVRISKRARHARIVVRPNLSVEVVLPSGMAKSRAAVLIQEKREWVTRSLKRFGEHAHPDLLAGSGSFPESISVEAIGEVLAICYRKTASDKIRVSELPGELHLTGAVDDSERVRLALQRWLKQKAKLHLPQMLEKLALLHGYQYQRVTVRLQKSRWGSCSKGRSISLNAKLMFLPEPLVRYVILHELAHLKHMNHSPAFWATVACTEPAYLSHIKQMRRTSAWVPLWAD